jgi:predicted GIY-YIG superfamily endonuclease
MKFVYILQSEADKERFYVGVADDVDVRLKKHNSGAVTHTSKYVPS